MSPAGIGAAAYKPSRLLAWLRDWDLHLEPWLAGLEEVITSAGAICIALVVFGAPIYFAAQGTGLLRAFLG